MKKKVFIIHRWSGNPHSDWYPKVAHELESRGFEVIVPEMPNTHVPIIEERVPYLSNLVVVPDENTYFIGHSIGVQTIMRYFETLPEGTQVGGAIFVAGWFNLGGALYTEGEEAQAIARPWIESPIDLKKIRFICPKIRVFLSSNDPYDYVEHNKETFEARLGAEVTILENRGHFTEDDGAIELPEVPKALEELQEAPEAFELA